MFLLLLRSEPEVRDRRYKNMLKTGKKAFIRLCTNLGDLNFQLDVDMAPRTCHNFLTLCP